ncbi:Uu.00g084050.m01.CDS01 [Anthostomella pinea]|uniref:Uu.00g084050.m01.CDS01 n=1 Tax=Anthostomella pinea TaxID=933095 RepID=A0AAI8VLP8_9PEZI|nr:Uu.00g084050.m01.CDS01 [Anthostomella pinea]
MATAYRASKQEIAISIPIEFSMPAARGNGISISRFFSYHIWGADVPIRNATSRQPTRPPQLRLATWTAWVAVVCNSSYVLFLTHAPRHVIFTGNDPIPGF